MVGVKKNLPIPNQMWNKIDTCTMKSCRNKNCDKNCDKNSRKNNAPGIPNTITPHCSVLRPLKIYKPNPAEHSK